MTVANLRIALENAKKGDRTEEVIMLEKRIERKLKHSKYASEVKPKPKLELKIDGKKSKG